MNASQMKAGRAWLNMSQHELAEKTGLSQTYIARLEIGFLKSPNQKAIDKIKEVLTAAGIKFIGDTGIIFEKPDEEIKIESPQDEQTV